MLVRVDSQDAPSCADLLPCLALRQMLDLHLETSFAVVSFSFLLTDVSFNSSLVCLISSEKFLTGPEPTQGENLTFVVPHNTTWGCILYCKHTPKTSKNCSFPPTAVLVLAL